jgi:tetratricopeptide (TPR) repeat protein
MKKVRLNISLLAIALCCLGTPAQAQSDTKSTALAMAPPAVSAAVLGQRTQRPQSRARSQSNSRPSARPAQRPTSRPAARPAQRPTSRPTARPAQRQAPRPTARPAQRQAPRPTARPAQRPAPRPTARPAQRQAPRPTARPAQRQAPRPTARPAQRPAPRPTPRPSAQPSRSTAPTNRRGSTPTRTTDPRSRSNPSGINPGPTYTPKPTRTVVPRVSNSSALQRARERARSTARPKSKSLTTNQPTTAQRIQQDRLRRARTASKTQSKAGAARNSIGAGSKTGSKTPLDKARASAGAARIQAARDRMKKVKDAGARSRTKPQDGLKVKPIGQRTKGSETKTGSKLRPDSLNGKKQTGRKDTKGKGRPTIQAREKRRVKSARKDYVDSKRDGISPGGLIARKGRPGLDKAHSSNPGRITSGSSGSGGGITSGSGHGRNLWSHNNGDYRRNPFSNYYWNWNAWGSGYGWFWCPTQWATTCWWEAYWYNGGSWNYGYRPSFYYSGPFTPPSYTVIVQVNQEPIYIEEEQASPQVQVAEAIAPAPAVVPAINRAAEYYLTLGDRAFRGGRYSDAVHHYGKAVEYSPGEGILYLILSDALFATGDYHYGAFALRKAFDLDPGLVDLTVDKRSFYDRPVDLDAQMTRARTFILQYPADNDARLMLLANEVFTGNPDAALRLLSEPQSTATVQSNAGILLQERALIDQELAQQQADPRFEVVPIGQE